MVSKQRLVIIGNGMAGSRLVEEVLVRGGNDLFDIEVFGEEPCGGYNRVFLSGLLAGAEELNDIFFRPPTWYQEHGVILHAGVRAGWVDRPERQVYAPGGVTARYDVLVIATGSLPAAPPIQGLNGETGALREGVFFFRTLADCQDIVRYAAHARRAAVIGGGLLGLEAAHGLLKRGLEVDIVHLGPHLMETQLDGHAAGIVKQAMERMGARVHLEKGTSAMLGEACVTGLAFKDGTKLACDMAVVAAGTRPNVDLAKQAGLTVQRGIVVNGDLSCRNDEHVYAIGECAQHRGRLYGLVAPAWEQARVLADRLTGRDPKAVYKGSREATRLKVMGIEVAVMGEKDPGVDDEVVTYVEPSSGIYKKLIVRDGRLVGAILLGDAVAARRVLQSFDNEEAVPAGRSELLFPPARDAASADVAGMPGATHVCQCNGVTKDDIVAAVRAGHRSLRAVGERTRAGTGCGSCKPLVQAIVDLTSDGVVAEDRASSYYVPGLPLTKPELVKAVEQHGLRSVSAVFEALGGGMEDPGSKPALASLLSTVWGHGYNDERDARFINDRVHANIQEDGTFSVVPRMYGGFASAAELRRIADVAEKYHVPAIKLTGGQRIALLGIPKEQLPGVWRDLGMPSGHAYTKAVRTCKTCVGAGFCRHGLGDSGALGIMIEKRFQGIEAPHKIKMAVSGCPRNCAEATTKDMGAIAIGDGKWEVYIGGGAGSRVRKGDILCIAGPSEKVLVVIGRFLQYYRDRANYGERTYDFVERTGIQTLRRVLVDDVDGLCAGLDAAVQAAAEGYRDPWHEGEEPVHPGQFVAAIAAACS
ncbi:MAG: NAD(P)/FAD-dependent oxidoreductase [Chloroflexi bacterium]|nr:NAD(P)/FAD-dependent oxidoreductase [Chloroflexota bacterium]